MVLGGWFWDEGGKFKAYWQGIRMIRPNLRKMPATEGTFPRVQTHEQVEGLGLQLPQGVMQ